MQRSSISFLLKLKERKKENNSKWECIMFFMKVLFSINNFSKKQSPLYAFLCSFWKTLAESTKGVFLKIAVAKKVEKLPMQWGFPVRLLTNSQFSPFYNYHLFTNSLLLKFSKGSNSYFQRKLIINCFRVDLIGFSLWTSGNSCFCRSFQVLVNNFTKTYLDLNIKHYTRICIVR